MSESAPSGDATRTDRMPLVAVGLACATLGTVALFQLVGPSGGNLPWINHDAALLLRLASDLADGHALYVDRVEINPPSIFAWNLVAVGLARLFGGSLVATFHVLVAALSVVGAVSVWRSTRSTGGAVAAWSPLAYALVALALGSQHLGQRPHLFLIVFLPYLLRRLHVERAGVAGPAWAVAVGCAAAMKPHYVLLLGLTEALLLWRDRRPAWRSWAASIVGAALPFGVLGVVSPGSVTAFFGDVLPLLRGAGAYGAFDVPLERALAGRWGVRLGLVCAVLVGFALVSRVRRRPGWETALVTLLPAAAIAFVVQQGKFYGYHFVPVLGLVCGVVPWGVARLLDEADDPRAVRLVLKLGGAGLGIAVLLAGALLVRTQRAGLPDSRALSEWVEGGPTAVVLSSTVAAQSEAAGCEGVWRLVGRWGTQRLRVQLLLGEAAGEREAAAEAYRLEIQDELAATEPDLVFVSITRSPALRRSLADVLRDTVLPGTEFVRVPDEEVAQLGHAWEIFEVYRRRADR